MGALDRFGGPEAWDAHCAREDARREGLRRSGATCEGCARYTACPCGCGWGWCSYAEEVVWGAVAAAEGDYECWEGA